MLASRELMGPIAAPSWHNIIRVRPIAEVKVGSHVRTTPFFFSGLLSILECAPFRCASAILSLFGSACRSLNTTVADDVSASPAVSSFVGVLGRHRCLRDVGHTHARLRVVHTGALDQYKARQGSLERVRTAPRNSTKKRILFFRLCTRSAGGGTVRPQATCSVLVYTHIAITGESKCERRGLSSRPGCTALEHVTTMSLLAPSALSTLTMEAVPTRPMAS